MAFTFDLREFGNAFATRGRGRELREVLLDRLADGHAVRIDFAEVTNVSYSFADEFVGMLVAASDQASFGVELVNLNPSVERVVRDAVGRRRGELAAC